MPAPRRAARARSSLRPRALETLEESTPDALVASEEVAARGPGSVLEYAPPTAPPLLRGFRALRHRAFRLFYLGQLVSLIGTWMQSLAQSWLVLTLTGSALALGLVGVLQFLPVLLLSAFGGTIADRLPKRSVLLATQSTEMILAFILALLTYLGAVTYAHVLVLALLLGIASAIDMPTRQAFVVELVNPSDLLNAIALNASLFNAARLIGPALAGLLIGVIGIAGCFFLNGLSFLAVIVGLLLMPPSRRPVRHPSSIQEVLSDLREGFRYVRSHGNVLNVILLVGAVGTFGANFNVVLPLLAHDLLRVGATGLGWLMAAMGFGSLVASLGLAYLGRQPRATAILASTVVFALLEIALAPVSSFLAALVLLALIGAAMVLVSAVANTFVQINVPHRLRGRVMSIYTTVFVGTTPIGNAVAGWIAERAGPVGPLFLGGVATLVVAVGVGVVMVRSRARAAASPRDRQRE